VKISAVLGLWKHRRSLRAVALLSAVAVPPTALLAQSSSISLTSSSPASVYGAPVTFTATVPSGATGTVTFSANGTTMGTVPVNGTTAILTTNSLPFTGPMGNSIEAVWSGDPTNPAYLAQEVDQATPAIAWNPVGSTTINSTINMITTVAGNPNGGNLGDGGAASSANLINPYGVAVDGQGNIFIADTYNQRIRKIAISTGVITMVAGTGVAGYSGDGGPATSAALFNPESVAVDAAGNLYIADSQNYRIRKVDASTGIITTVAGTGTYATSYLDGSVAANTAIGYIQYLAVDAQGNLYLSDYYCIRKITVSTGTIATVAGTGVAGYSGDGGPATSAKISNYPGGIVVDVAGNLYIADTANSRVRRVDASTGIITTVAGSGLFGYFGDGDLATNTALYEPFALSFDSSGNLYIADEYNYRIRMVDASTGIISTVAGNGVWGHSGDGGFAAGASILNPTDVAVDSFSNVYIAENSSPGSIRKVALQNQAIASITYGTPLSAAQLNATASVPGTFSYTPPLGTVLPAGLQTLMVTFTPTDTQDYNPVTVGVPLDVNQGQATLTVATSNPSSNYGDTLTFTATISSGATGSVTFYDGSTAIGSAPISGTTATLTISSLAAGSHTITAAWLGDANNPPAASSAIIQVVNKAAPVITWPNPATVAGGTPLGAAQLNATANVPGTFVYSPGAGAVYSAVGTQTLSATFTPTDTADYSSISATITLNIVSAPVVAPTITWQPVGDSTITGSILTTVAGNGNPGFSGDSGLAINAALYFPNGIAADAMGNLYIADTANLRIRKLTRSTGSITTIAGNGSAVFSGDGGAAVSAALYEPYGVTVDSAGNVYIADTYNNRIRRITASTGIITTIAGNGTAGFSGDGGLATDAVLNFPVAVTVDTLGNIYISDSSNNCIRKITASTGIISTIAGTHTQGFSGDGGAAVNAQLSSPYGLAVDSAGNLFIADYGNTRIRRVDASTGIITTVAGNGFYGYFGDGDLAINTTVSNPFGVSLDPAGNLYIADYGNARVRKVDEFTGIISTVAGNGTPGYSGDGGLAAEGQLLGPTFVATDTFGDVYVNDYGNNRIRKFGQNNQLAALTFGTPLGAAQLDAVASVPGTFAYTPPAGSVLGTGLQTLSLTFTPTDTTYSLVAMTVPLIVTQGAAALSISTSDTSSFYSYPITFTATISGGTTGEVTFYDGSTLIGTAPINGTTGTLTLSSLMPGSHTITASWPGNFNYSSATSNSVTVNVAAEMQSDASNLTLTTSGTPSFYSQPVTFQATFDGDTDGYVTFFDKSFVIATVPVINNIATLTTSTLSTSGHTITAEWQGDVNHSGVTTQISSTITQIVLAADPAIAWLPVGDTTISSPVGYISTVAGNRYPDYWGDGGPAIDAQLYSPLDVATDTAGNFYIADTNNSRIRKVMPSTGVITTIAGNGTYGDSGDGAAATSAALYQPYGVALDIVGNIYVADTYNNRVRKVDITTGIITTIAGNGIAGYAGGGAAAINAELNFPTHVAVDRSGNIYIADANSSRIRKVSAADGTITTIAGTGAIGFSGDGGPAISAALSGPQGLALDTVDNLYIADRGNNRIRMVDAATGVITTVAGNGLYGYFGDGDLATDTGLSASFGVTVDPAGNIYIADTDTSRIRRVDASTGIITTVTGDSTSMSSPFYYTGDGGYAINASLHYPTAVAFDAQNNLYIADNGLNCIRKIDYSSKAVASIPYGTSLNATQLDAIADVPGTFVYAPPNGTVLDAGLQALSVTFTPSDTLDYNTVRVSAPLMVRQVSVTLGLSVSSTSPLYGDLLTFTAFVSDGVSGTVTFYDGSVPIGTAPISGTTATLVVSTLAAGSHTITASWSGDTNHTSTDSNSINISISAPPPNVTQLSPTSGSVGSAVTIIGTNFGASQANGSVTFGGQSAFVTSWTDTTIVVSVPNQAISGDVVVSVGGLASNPVFFTVQAEVQDHTINTFAGTGVRGNSGDGGAALNAQLYSPHAVDTDSGGNVYVLDSSAGVIRKIDNSTKIISTVAGNGVGVSAYTGESLGNSGPAKEAQIDDGDFKLDSSGNIYVIDSLFNNVRVVCAVSSGPFCSGKTIGNIYIIAGNNQNSIPVNGNYNAGFSGDGSPAGSALLNGPQGAAIDSAGNLFIADTGNSRIRKIDAATGTIVTVAGNGNSAYSGDNILATNAQFRPISVAMDGAGNIFLLDGVARMRVICYSQAGFFCSGKTTGNILAEVCCGDGNRRRVGLVA